MRRKLIKQGISGLTIYLPKKWIDKNNLENGDEVEIEEKENFILISNQNNKKNEKIVELKLGNWRENIIRMKIVNAYRSGFDKIKINYKGNESMIRDITKKHLIGMEVFSENENYVIESVAEPNYNDFEKIINKVFFILKDILQRVDVDNIEEQVHIIQRYDNYLKRALSKNVFSIKANMQLWQFLSLLAHISLYCKRLNQNIEKKFDSYEMSLKNDLVEMINLLHKAYLTKNIQLAASLNEYEQNIIYDNGLKNMKKHNPIYSYFLLSIARHIYLSASPLIGIIQAA